MLTTMGFEKEEADQYVNVQQPLLENTDDLPLLSQSHNWRLLSVKHQASMN